MLEIIELELVLLATTYTTLFGSVASLCTGTAVSSTGLISYCESWAGLSVSLASEMSASRPFRRQPCDSDVKRFLLCAGVGARCREGASRKLGGNIYFRGLLGILGSLPATSLPRHSLAGVVWRLRSYLKSCTQRIVLR